MDSRHSSASAENLIEHGIKYENKKNYAEAKRLYELAANENYPRGWYRLANLYSKGKIVEENNQESQRLYDLVIAAATKKNIVAQTCLGAMYANGQGVVKDYAEAKNLFRASAEKRHARAQYNLGVMYIKGQGVAKDYAKAIKWIRLGAEQKHAKAQYALGWMYENGRGVTKDYSEAIKWFRLSAEQEHARAQYNLGLMYIKGQGVAKDYAEAIKWFSLSAEQGDVDSAQQLKCIEPFLLRSAETDFFKTHSQKDKITSIANSSIHKYC
jgi:uncharacterized protein